MPWYGPDPVETIIAAREKGRDYAAPGGAFSQGLDVNFKKRPWTPTPAKFEEEEVEPITLGDPDFNMREYLIDAGVPSAHAETLKGDAAEQAAEALEKYGHIVDPETRGKWEQVAALGRTEDESNWFTNFINVIDAPGELIRMGIADVFGIDSKMGAEIGLRDYWDALIGNEDLVRERVGSELAGEGQFLFEGQTLLENAGLFKDEAAWGAKFGTGLLFDIITDPFTYVSFGTVGLGKKVAMEAAQAGISKAGREAVEAVAKGTTRELTDSASKEIAQRITRRIDDALEELPSKGKGLSDQLYGEDAIRESILSQERRALELTAGQKIDPLTARKGVPTGTAVESAINDVLPHLADKQFRTLANSAGWYMESGNIQNIAKGGLQIGAPFGRKKFPMLRIKGTETNRLASKLFGREIKDKVMSKTPQGFQSLMGRISRRVGTEQDVYARARAGTLWSTQAEQSRVKALLDEILPANATAPFRHGVKAFEEAAKEAGVEYDEVHRLAVRVLSGESPRDLGVPAKVAQALEGAVFGDASAGVAGIKDVLNTFYDAARKVGLDIGRVENYVPIVMANDFNKLIDNLVDEGLDLSMEMLERATSTESRVGMEILSRYLHNTGAGLLGVPGTDPAFTQFAKRNKVTSIFRHALGGHNLEDIARTGGIGLDEILDLGGYGRLTPIQANEYVKAAFEDLIRFDPKVTRKMADAFDQAFYTDLNDILKLYTVSMTEAIQYRELIRGLRRLNLLQEGERAIDISATLASVSGRINKHSAQWINEVVDQAGTDRASRLVKVKVGGRTLNVPAALSESAGFKEAAKKLNRVFSRVDRRGKEIASAIENRARKLIADGVPDEWAYDLALSAGDTELGRAMNDIGEAVFDEILTLEMAAAEMGARGAGNAEDLLQAAASEAQRIRDGAIEVMEELDTQIRSALDLTHPRRSERVVDLMDPTNAPAGYSTPIQWLADQAEASLIKSQGNVQEMIQRKAALQGRLKGASRGEIAREGVFDLADRATVANLTVGELVDFSGPRMAARMLGEANARMLEAGYAGVGSLTDEIVSAVDDVMMAERNLLEATMGGLDTEETVEAAMDLLRQAEANLDEVAEGLRGSDELVGDIMEHVAETVDEVNDSILMSPVWRDMWAAALHKQPIERGLAKLSPEEIAEGLEDLTVKELTQRHAKGVARQNADMVRDLWQRASTSETAHLAERATAYEAAGPSNLRRAMEAMKAADSRALPAYADEVRAIIGRITDDAGRPVFDPARITVRQSGEIVYEPAEMAWVTLSDVYDDIVQVVAQPELPFTEQLAILRDAWENTPQAIGDVSDNLSAFMRQLDQAGGLPQEIEDYQYLRTFVGDLEATAHELNKVSGSGFSPELKQAIAENPEEWAFQGTYRGDFEGVKFGGLSTDIEKAEGWAKGTAARREGEAVVVAVRRDDLVPAVRSTLDREGVVQQLPKGHPTIPIAGSYRVGEATGKPATAGLDVVTDVLDEVNRVFGRAVKTPRKLTRLWAEGAETIADALPAEEFDRLARLVGLAEASGRIRPTKFPNEWRQLVGEADQTFDLFNLDIASLNRQVMDLGEEWAGEVAADAAYFRETLLSLFEFSDDQRRVIRPGFHNLEEYGAEFERTLQNARKAASKLRRSLKKTRKHPELAEFLPEVPGPERKLSEFLDEFFEETMNWPTIPAAKAKKGMVDLKIAGLGGESVEGLVADPSVALWLENIAANAATVTTDRGLRVVAESMREIEKWWKGAATVARPTFVPRNIMGGIINGMLTGTGPRQYAFVNKHARTLRNLVEGGMLPEEAIAKLPAKVRPYFEGLWESELLHHTFSHTLEGLQSATRMGSKVNPFSHANYAFKAGGRFMQHSEDFLRAAVFVRWYDPDNPATMRLAREMSLAVHFDYTSLTKMESNIKKLVPFFVWTRRNIPLQLRAMVEQPGHLMRFVHLKENIEHSLSDKNSWVDELDFARSKYLSFFAVGTNFVFDEDTPFWQRLIMDPDIPLADIEEITKAFSGGPTKTAEWLIRSLSPIYSAPLELFSDYQTVAPTGLREILMAADYAAPGQGVFGFDPVQGREEQYYGPAWAGNWFSTLFPFFGEWTRVTGVVPPSASQQARGGFNIEDGVQMEERLKAAALGLGRAVGAHLQTPGDTRSQAWEAIFDVEDDVELLQKQGKAFSDEEDLQMLVETILAREEIEDGPSVEELIAGLDISP